MTDWLYLCGQVPPEYKARVERMDAEREAWLDGWKNAGKDHPDWQQQWTAIEAVEQQNLVQVNFGEPSPLMELAEQAQKTDTDDVHEQLRLVTQAPSHRRPFSCKAPTCLECAHWFRCLVASAFA